MLEHDLSLTDPGSVPVLPFHEVRHSVLNPGSLSFVAANAPCDVVTSFEARQQRLASFSLRVASNVLVQQLRKSERDGFNLSLWQLFQSLELKMKGTLLLIACTLGRLGLGAIAVLRHRIHRHLQIGLSANILRNVETLLNDSEVRCETTCQHLGSPGAPRAEALETVHAEETDSDSAAADILRALTVSLPNDLSRLIFVATLRDNNSGHYFHPELARRFSDCIADLAMLACHQCIYKRVVALPIEDLTDQLDLYITTVPAPRERMMESWRKLKAYRATIPMDTDPISAEIFFMKVEVAVAILEARLLRRIH